jgi:hypothetical protein
MWLKPEYLRKMQNPFTANQSLKMGLSNMQFQILKVVSKAFQIAFGKAQPAPLLKSSGCSENV